MDVEGSEQNFTVHLQEGAVEPLNQEELSKKNSSPENNEGRCSIQQICRVFNCVANVAKDDSWQAKVFAALLYYYSCFEFYLDVAYYFELRTHPKLVESNTSTTLSNVFLGLTMVHVLNCVCVGHIAAWRAGSKVVPGCIANSTGWQSALSFLLWVPHCIAAWVLMMEKITARISETCCPTCYGCIRGCKSVKFVLILLQLLCTPLIIVLAPLWSIVESNAFPDILQIIVSRYAFTNLRKSQASVLGISETMFDLVPSFVISSLIYFGFEVKSTVSLLMLIISGLSMFRGQLLNILSFISPPLNKNLLDSLASNFEFAIQYSSKLKILQETSRPGTDLEQQNPPITMMKKPRAAKMKNFDQQGFWKLLELTTRCGITATLIWKNIRRVYVTKNVHFIAFCCGVWKAKAANVLQVSEDEIGQLYGSPAKIKDERSKYKKSNVVHRSVIKFFDTSVLLFDLGYLDPDLLGVDPSRPFTSRGARKKQRLGMKTLTALGLMSQGRSQPRLKLEEDQLSGDP